MSKFTIFNPPFIPLLQDSCPSIKNILILDSEGKRVAVKYYSDDWPTNSAKLAFEKSLFTKTMKMNARIEGMLPKHHYVTLTFLVICSLFLSQSDDE